MDSNHQNLVDAEVRDRAAAGDPAREHGVRREDILELTRTLRRAVRRLSLIHI